MEAPLDLLVIGAGACGLAGAIAAHDAGASVGIVEKEPRPGGNSALSTGTIPGAGSRYQRAAGVEDGPEQLRQDLMAVAGPHEAEHLTALVAERSGALCEWLIEVVGCRMTFISAYRHVGHSVERLHAPPSRRGQDLVDDLLRAVEGRGIPLALGQGAERLLVDGGRVVGAMVGGEAIAARAVLLATNGFAGDRGLVARHCAEIAGAPYLGAPGSTGEAVRWGLDLGAAFGNMSAYQGYAAVARRSGQILSWTTIEKGGVLVDRHGRRFGDEGAGYSGFAPAVLAAEAPVWAVYDQRIHEIALAEEEYAEMAAMRAIHWAETPEGLAAAIGLPSDGLTQTLSACGRAPDAFGRSALGLAPFEPPYAAVEVGPALFHTQGGLKVDASARVLRADGRAIPGLFAGGGAAAGISGASGGAGYASGNGLVTALLLGRVAGETAALASGG